MLFCTKPTVGVTLYAWSLLSDAGMYSDNFDTLVWALVGYALISPSLPSNKHDIGSGTRGQGGLYSPPNLKVGEER